MYACFSYASIGSTLKLSRTSVDSIKRGKNSYSVPLTITRQGYVYVEKSEQRKDGMQQIGTGKNY